MTETKKQRKQLKSTKFHASNKTTDTLRVTIPTTARDMLELSPEYMADWVLIQGDSGNNVLILSRGQKVTRNNKDGRSTRYNTKSKGNA